ncbi:type II secretion system protein GspC [Halioxenophilus aromaticivorans]|uniref:Type II secretion system protein GspC n=1 Tax=Halioxenophilus aromaticivorans TaxID=1306992 RepID=A0AAV3U5I1_9ALTE
MNQPSNTASFSAKAQKWFNTPQNIVLVRNTLVVLLLLWACFTLARLFWVLMPSATLPEVPTATPYNAVLEGKPSAKLNVDVEPLLAAELFGPLDANAPEPEQLPQQQQLTVAGETSLNLTLRGVIKSSVPENSEAIIANGREEHVYRVGDKLPVGNRVRLVQVEADRVILENNGRNEALSLFDENAASVGSSNTYSGRSGANSAPIRSSAAPRIENSIDEDDDDAPNRSDSRTLQQMPKSLADVIKFSVARDGGDIIGYKIRPGRNRDAFNSLGLKANDIVTDINGIALTSSGSVTQVYREMRTATSASVTLLREGQSMQMNVDLASNQ